MNRNTLVIGRFVFSRVGGKWVQVASLTEKQLEEALAARRGEA